MSARETLEVLERAGLVVILRSASAQDARATAAAARHGGAEVVEVTYSVPDALEVIRELSEEPATTVGAGTVIGRAQAIDAIDAGARFVVSPGVDEDVIRACVDRDVLVLPGVQTATEAMRASALGAIALKLFPASTVGVAHLRALLAPFPDYRIIPSGGVGMHDLEAWLRAGAAAVGIGGALSPAGAVDAGAATTVRAHAAEIIRTIRQVREGNTP